MKNCVKSFNWLAVNGGEVCVMINATTQGVELLENRPVNG